MQQQCLLVTKHVNRTNQAFLTSQLKEPQKLQELPANIIFLFGISYSLGFSQVLASQQRISGAKTRFAARWSPGVFYCQADEAAALRLYVEEERRQVFLDCESVGDRNGTGQKENL